MGCLRVDVLRTVRVASQATRVARRAKRRAAKPGWCTQAPGVSSSLVFPSHTMFLALGSAQWGVARRSRTSMSKSMSMRSGPTLSILHYAARRLGLSQAQRVTCWPEPHLHLLHATAAHGERAEVGTLAVVYARWCRILGDTPSARACPTAHLMQRREQTAQPRWALSHAGRSATCATHR